MIDSFGLLLKIGQAAGICFGKLLLTSDIGFCRMQIGASASSLLLAQIKIPTGGVLWARSAGFFVRGTLRSAEVVQDRRCASTSYFVLLFFLVFRALKFSFANFAVHKVLSRSSKAEKQLAAIACMC